MFRTVAPGEPQGLPPDIPEPPATPGLLYRLGRLLDAPGRAIRETLTGVPDASGRDVLRTFGLAGGPNQPGLDWGDVPDFAAEVVLDPLTYLGGLGALTKTGKAVAQVDRGRRSMNLMRDTLRAAKDAEDVARVAAVQKLLKETQRATVKNYLDLRKLGQAEGRRIPMRLPGTWAEQGKAGLRQTFGIDVPFGPKRPLSTSPGGLAVLEKLKGKIAAPFRAFNTRAGKLAETRPIWDTAEMQKLTTKHRGFAAMLEADTATRELAEVLGRDPAEFQREIMEATEAIGVDPSRAYADVNQMEARALAITQEHEKRLREYVAEKNRARAEAYLAGATARAREMEAAAEEADRFWRLRGEERAARLAELRNRPWPRPPAPPPGPAPGPAGGPGRPVKPVSGEAPFDAAQGLGAAGRKLMERLQQTRLDHEAVTKKIDELLAKGKQPGKKLQARLSHFERLEDSLVKKIEKLGKDWDRSRGEYWRGRASSLMADASARAKRILDTPMSPALAEKIEKRRAWLQAAVDRRREQVEAALNKAVSKLNAVPEEVEPYVQELERLMRVQLLMEKAAGVPTPELQSKYVGYMAHILGPEARVAREGEGEIVRRIRENTVKGGFQTRREDALREMYVGEANEALAKLGGPEKSFIEDPATAVWFRQHEGEEKITAGLVALNLAKQFAGKELASMPGAAKIPVDDFFKAAGIRVPSSHSNLLGKSMPKAVADEYLAIQQKLAAPSELKGLRGGLDATRRYFAAWLLPLFPAYHTRNAESNIISSWIGGYFHPRYYKQAIEIFKDPARRAEMEARGVLKGGVTREISTSNIQRQLRERVYEGKKEGGPLDFLKFWEDEAAIKTPIAGKGIQFGYKVGDAVEGVSRIAHYLAALDKGMDPVEALNSVKKYLFNADELTDVEKTYLRPFVFFYSWFRKAIERMSVNIFEHPQKMALLSRAVTQPSSPRRTLPEWLQSTPGWQLGQDKEGNSLYVTGLGTPLESFQQVDFLAGAGPGIPGKVTAALQKLGAISAPPYKQAAELMADRDFRIQRPLVELDRTYPSAPWNLLPGYKEEQLPDGRTRPRADPYALYALRNSPLSRIFTDASKAMDPTKSPVTAALNALTGIKTVSVNEPEERARMILKELSNKLKVKEREGTARQFRMYFATGKSDELKDEETVELMRQQNAVLKHLRGLRAQ